MREFPSSHRGFSFWAFRLHRCAKLRIVPDAIDRYVIAGESRRYMKLLHGNFVGLMGAAEREVFLRALVEDASPRARADNSADLAVPGAS